MKFNELRWVDYLRKITQRGGTAEGNIAIGDDCAIVKQGEIYQLFTSDLSIEGVHFSRNKSSLETIGRRALQRAISDIAACAGSVRFIGVSMGFSDCLTVNDLKKIAKAIADEANVWGAQLIGGDLARTDNLFFDVWVIGETPKAITRCGAQEGDCIFLSGPLGELSFNDCFKPRIKQALWLRDHFRINAMIDISDGFAVDLYRLLTASNKGALIEAAKLPLTRGISDIYRGEDYELLFTVNATEPKIAKLREDFIEVGRVKSKGFGFWLENKDGSKQHLKAEGYSHL
jgi:thiamine-monophosphate kinase